MRKMLILSILLLVVASTTGCFHRGCCGGGTSSMLGMRPQPQPMAMQCCDPCAAPQQMMQAPCCP